MNKIYYELKAYWKIVIFVRISCFLYFIRIAWLMLTGKLMYVDSKKSISNGGFKYLDLIISKRPFSKEHKYDEF